MSGVKSYVTHFRKCGCVCETLQNSPIRLPNFFPSEKDSAYFLGMGSTDDAYEQLPLRFYEPSKILFRFMANLRSHLTSF